MPAPRLYIAGPLAPHTELTLPERTARHAQVLRLQPGDPLALFNGQGGEWDAALVSIGRREVRVRVGVWHEASCELAPRVTLAIGMPANERMDWLIEKATELGAAVVQPLECERAVLRLSGERAQRRRAHWQTIAIAASEQSGRTAVPAIEPVRRFQDWLAALRPVEHGARLMLSVRDGQAIGAALAGRAPQALLLLSGPEGGLTPAEAEAARDRAGFEPCTLGPRVLRADTAPLVALAQFMTLIA